MDLAARRPTLTAGLALASAAILAAGPMTQHLPKFDVAHHLPRVSVTDIDLADASQSMMDLFSGVESELATLAGGATAAAAVPASVLTDVSPYAVNPFQTWISALSTAGANLQAVGASMYPPAPVLQQLAANALSYATDFVTSPQLIPGIPGSILQGITNNLGSWTTGGGGVVNLLGYAGIAVLAAMQGMSGAIGTGLQNIFNAAAAGDPLGVVTNVANFPGAVANGVLNGVVFKAGKPPTNGLLSPGNNLGFLQEFATYVLPNWAKNIVAPGAQNIEKGGSLAAGMQSFLNALQTGWLSPGGIATNLNNLGPQLAALPQNFSAFLSNLPSTLDNLAATPAPVLQQVVANWEAYATLYVSTYQAAANHAVAYFGSNAKAGFANNLINIWQDFQTGQFFNGVTTAYTTLLQAPIINIGEPMEAILGIPTDISQNITNAYNFVADGNGIVPALAGAMVAPNAQNISNGGSVAVGFQNLLNTAQNGWPSLASIQNVVNKLVGLGSLSNLGTQLTGLLQSIPSALANLPSAISGLAGTFASQIGTLLINLLKML